jgi:hypothetical protein
LDLRRARELDSRWSWCGSSGGAPGLPLWTLEHAVSRYPRSSWLREWLSLERARAGAGALAVGEQRASPAPEEALEHLRSMGMLQDFLAVEHGLRPAAFYYDLPARTTECLALLCERSGLNWGRYRDPGTGDERTVWARDRRRLKKALKDGGRGGQTLPDETGYPACCVERTRDIVAEHPDIRTRPAYPLLTLAATRAKPPFRFKSNYLYHMENRDWGKRGLKGRRSEHSQYHLIPWTPCSFDCAPSLAYAERMLALLRRALPEFAVRLEQILRRPVLLWSDFVFVGLEVEARGRELTMRGWDDPCGMIPARARAALDSCARIAPGRTGVHFLREDGAPAAFPSPPTLFFFS